MAGSESSKATAKTPLHPDDGPNRGRSAFIVAIEAMDNAAGAVVCVSVKNYHALELKLGLAGTDEFIGVISATLAEKLPPDSTCVRLTDNTFGVLLPRADGSVARKLTGEIVDAIAGDVIKIGTHAVHGQFDFGIAPVSPDRSGAASIESAFAATHRPAVVLPADNERPPKADRPEKPPQSIDPEGAENEYRLSVEFQPIVHLYGEPIELYELFLRVKYPHGAQLPPRHVAAAATGMDVALDMWAVDRAIEVIDGRRKSGVETLLFVKLSHHCIEDIRVPLAINRALKSRSIPGENLIVELKESAVSANPREAHAFLQSVTEAGCLAAVNNFGPSTSEFELLEKLPISFVRLNTALVEQLTENEHAVGQVAKICARAKALKIRTIASNVNDPAILPKLFEAGVEFAQGSRIQEPRPSMGFAFDIVIE